MKYLNYFKESKNWIFSYADNFKIYTFEIEGYKIKVIFNQYGEEENGPVSISYMVNDSHNKITSIKSMELFTTIRKILYDYIEKYNPSVITMMPSDKDQLSLSKKEKINSLINIPNYTKRKIGISTVFSRIGSNDE